MAETKITIIPNGPILIPGNATYKIGDGEEQTYEGKSPNVALCRCGLSTNKPFCDGSHNGKFEGDACEVNLKND